MDNYGLEASGIDPEIAMQMLGLKRRKSVAEALQKQAMTPIQQQETPRGGYAVRTSGLEVVAKLLQAYMGAKGLQDADKEQAGLMSQNQQKVADAMAGYEKQRAGTPEMQPVTPNDDDGNANPIVSATKGDPVAAIRSALSNPLTAGNAAVKFDASRLPKEQEPFSLNAGQVRFGPDGKPIARADFKPQGPPKAPMNDFQIASLEKMVMEGIDLQQDVSGLVRELQDAKAARAALKAGQPQAPAATAQPTAQPATGQIPGEIVVPPEVIAAANAGKPFTATQAPGQAPQIQTAGLSPRDQRAAALDQVKSTINVNEERAKSAFSPAVQKEIIQVDEENVSSGLALKSLQQALALNDKAMGFPGAGVVATMGTFLPESVRSEMVDNTQLLDNALSVGALPQMRAIFGSNPTEGERKILLDIQGSSSKNPAVRKVIFDNAINALNTRVKTNEAKAAKLRSGDYFSPQSPTKPEASEVSKITNDAEYAALKPGSTFVGPDGKTRRKP